MWRSGTAVTLVSALTLPAMAGDGGRDGKPKLAMRAAPRFAFAPASVLLTAELVGGEGIEDLYCPALEWSWGDGETSTQEADCAPFGPEAVLERSFSARHAYREGGAFQVRLALKRAGRTVAATTALVTIRSRFGSLTAPADGF